jgi:hypothetical protein
VITAGLQSNRRTVTEIFDSDTAGFCSGSL